MRKRPSCKLYDIEYFSLRSHYRAVINTPTGEEQRELLSDFFLALAVCHTVIPEKGVSTTSSSRRRRLSKRQHGSSNDGDKHLVNSSVDKCGVMEGDIENVSPKEREREEECSEDSDGRADDDCCGDEDDIDCCIDDGIYDIDADGDGEREREEGVLEEMKRREGEKGRREEKEDEAPPKLSASSPDDEALVRTPLFTCSVKSLALCLKHFRQYLIKIHQYQGRQGIYISHQTHLILSISKLLQSNFFIVKN